MVTFFKITEGETLDHRRKCLLEDNVKFLEPLFDPALVGKVEGKVGCRAVYDRAMCVSQMVYADIDLDYAEAEELFDNIVTKLASDEDPLVVDMLF